MYQVTVYNIRTFQTVGPIFFTGEGEDYETLASARKAATDWISLQVDKSDLQVQSRIVGCL
jgi:hypothetical protein